MIAPLAWFIGGRSGPLWVGIAASLKIFPILYVLTYLGRGQWVRALVAVASSFLQIVKEPMPEPEPEPAAAPVV